MTSLLSATAFHRARHFLETQARPLEAARFRFHFEGAPADHVLSVLVSYQHSDGGFGHALEPDFRASTSSILCTSVAFQILRTIHASPSLDMVQRAIAYCLTTLNLNKNHWRIIPRAINATYPHAPWWSQSAEDDRFEAFSLNPTAEMLGYLYDYRAQIPSDIIASLSTHVMTHITNLDSIEMHDLLCCMRLRNTQTLPHDVGDRLHQTLARLIPETVSIDPELWKTYGLRPLQVIDNPESPFQNGLEEAIAANLDYEIASQNPDGSWSPSWSWGDRFPEEWAIAHQEWSGILTLDMLLTLRRFNKLEGVS
ncbi:MAG: hypothetical protein AAGA75_15190 [Cyanobacteria bacterium P01_E01_bin.6]